MAGGHSHSFFYYLGVSPEYDHIAGAALATTVLAGVGLHVHSKLKNIEANVLPKPEPSLLNCSVGIVSFWKGIMDDMIGEGADRFMPIVGGTFLFILVNNLMGIIPNSVSATSNFYTNIAMGAFVFLAYNYFGFKEHGFGYLKQFTGGLPAPGYGKAITVVLTFFAGAMILIELISHAVRPLSLSIRLFGNINGDHTVVGVFASLVPLVVPVIFLAFGVFVSFIQAFVFSILTAVYFKLAVSHDH